MARWCQEEHSLALLPGSLRALLQLPASYLQIDQSTVRHLELLHAMGPDGAPRAPTATAQASGGGKAPTSLFKCARHPVPHIASAVPSLGSVYGMGGRGNARPHRLDLNSEP